LPDIIRDLKHTFRRLARTPLFTLATIVTLALGIGANTAIFSVINGVLLEALPFPEPNQLVGVWQTAPGVNIKDLNACLADYVTYREESQTFADVALWKGRSMTVTEFADAERVDGISVTFRLLPLLGVNPVLGRGFEEKDSDTKSPDVMMLGYGYWQRRFGGDPNVIGRRILADGAAREIIGVLPKDFWFMDIEHDLIVPIRFDRGSVHLAGYNFQSVARLRPGVTIQEANTDIARMIGIELAKIPPPEGMSTKMMEDARLGPNVRLLSDDLLGDIATSLWVVMATIGIVLLIACANVANLLLVRAEGRAQELAVRSVLGAGRGRLAREMFVESLTLALLGGLAGIGFAVIVVKVVLALSPTRLPRFDQIAIGGKAVLFTLAISVVAGFAFGVIPILKHSRVNLAEALRSGGRTASSSRDRNIARNSLTVVQVALALVLLIGSGLMVRSFQSMRKINPGFSQPAALQTFRISTPRNATTKDAEALVMQQTLIERLAALPGITDVGLIDDLPMTDSQSQDPIFASDHTYAPDQIPPLRRFIRVAPGTFKTLGAPLVAGREYTWTDLHGNLNFAIISENFAREYWGSAEAALGKQIRSNPTEPWSEVIGVVGDIRHNGADRSAPATVYWPLREPYSLTYMVRTARAGTDSLATEIRQTVSSVNSSIPITALRTMKEVYEKSMSRTSFTLTLLGISGVMALLLAVVGIYAVISYTVAQRTREIGIRMALGAQSGSVKLMFVRNGLVWGATGAGLGLIAAAALSQLMSTLLFGIKPIDPLTYIAVAITLLAATAVASYLPARRITRVNPVDALRAE
jgi:putative ABC transport system permease protein